MGIDPLAQTGFGSGADDYDRHRPGWPPEAVERALAELRLGRSATVVDLAAGTGKLTRELAARTGRTVAVEPSADMLRRLREVVPEADALEGTAESIPLEDASADAVFAAEAFHWFATREAVAEIARVVRPGGGVVLLWNLHDFGNEPWAVEAGEVLSTAPGTVLGTANRYRPERWEAAFDGAPFTPHEEFSTRHEQRTDLDGLVAHVATWSHTRALEEQARAGLLRELRDVLGRTHPSPNEVVIPYRTQVHWARRT